MQYRLSKTRKIPFCPPVHSLVRWCCVATAVVREQERTRTASHLFSCRVALLTRSHADSFSVRHSHQRINLSRSILLRVNLSCKDVEIVVEKAYAPWRARSSLLLDKSDRWRAPGDRWLKYNFLLQINDKSSYARTFISLASDSMGMSVSLSLVPSCKHFFCSMINDTGPGSGRVSRDIFFISELFQYFFIENIFLVGG